MLPRIAEMCLLLRASKSGLRINQNAVAGQVGERSAGQRPRSPWKVLGPLLSYGGGAPDAAKLCAETGTAAAKAADEL
jgi:hypothetical protein